MNNYRDSENFLKAVHEGNTPYIQTEIADMILTLDGDRDKILEAVDYARANSEFQYEQHSSTDTAREADTIQDAFFTEKSELNFNFSEERLLQAIALYQRMKQIEEKQRNSEPNDFNVRRGKSDGGITKKILFGGGIIVGGILIYILIN